jgi:hypothetical protein
MAIIPPEFQSLADALAEAGSSDEVQPLDPAEHPVFETELARFERRLRSAREHPLFGVHPDGVGPTLGQDLGRPNTGDDLDFDHMGFKPHD